MKIFLNNLKVALALIAIASSLQSIAQPTSNTMPSAQSSLPSCNGNDPKNWSNCLGTFTYGNGNIYTGEYQNGKREGVGQIRIVAKGTSNANRIASDVPSTYIGEWKNNKMNGRGVWITDTGQRYEGNFVDNTMTSSASNSQQNQLNPIVDAINRQTDAINRQTNNANSDQLMNEGMRLINGGRLGGDSGGVTCNQLPYRSGTIYCQ